MWRRVASQSPIEPPKNAAAAALGARYFHAWDALSKLLGDGRSLSGRERHCCFLNTGAQRFADISAASGLDFPDDGRGVAVVDWDADGDLDVWISNRTGPRVRFLRNDYHSQHHFLALKLQGVQCNRDAIGARVEVEFDSPQPPLVKSLRAGEGYLAQSSKWLHVGLGEPADVKQVRVDWPNGKQEVFRGLGADGRYLLVQNSGVARKQTSSPPPNQLVASTPHEPSSPPGARIVLPARLPMPDLSYRAGDVGAQTVPLIDENTKSPVLINLWATWCGPCLEEIAGWVRREQEFRAAGVNVVLLHVDDSAEGKSVEPDKIREVLDRLGGGVIGLASHPGSVSSGFTAGLATPELLDKLDIVQQQLTKRRRPMPIPTSFLVDAQGRLAVVYKGQASADRILADIRNLPTPDQQQRDLAVPFAGRWYTNPFPPDLLAIPRQFLELNKPDEALAYLQRHVQPSQVRSDAEQSFYETMSADNLADIYVQLGISLQRKNDSAKVVSALQSAVQVKPNYAQARIALAMIFQQSGRHAGAVDQYRQLLRIKPDDPVTMNNLAWLLATSPDAAVRSPAEAVRLAEIVCEKSHRQLPSALDTLAAAYAAAGRFDEAASTAGEAVKLLEQARKEAEAQAIRNRLKQYQQRKSLQE